MSQNFIFIALSNHLKEATILYYHEIAIWAKIRENISPLGRTPPPPPHLRSWNNIPGTPCSLELHMQNGSAVNFVVFTLSMGRAMAPSGKHETA